MRRMGWILLALLVLATAGGVWIRVAPSDPSRWHADPAQAATGRNAHVARVHLDLPPDRALEAVAAVALAEPRTVLLAGSPAEGMMTFVSRSALWGFPDYITVLASADGTGTSLVIHGRARFGASDLGVNAARTGRWLDALGLR